MLYRQKESLEYLSTAAAAAAGLLVFRNMRKKAWSLLSFTVLGNVCEAELRG